MGAGILGCKDSMQSPPGLVTYPNLAKEFLGASQSTFRRTPLRIRVEDLMNTKNTHSGKYQITENDYDDIISHSNATGKHNT